MGNKKVHHDLPGNSRLTCSCRAGGSDPWVWPSFTGSGFSHGNVLQALLRLHALRFCQLFPSSNLMQTR